MKMLISTENMTRDEWLRWRRSGIGGSDAAVACGISRYKSMVQLWMEKTGQLEADEAGEAAYWGNVMEPIIRHEFIKRSGIDVRELKAILKHDKYPFMLANLDGITQDNCIFEAKTASAFKTSEWNDGIPDEYMLQLQHYMSVTGLKGAYIAALIGGNTFHWQYIPRDDVTIDMLISLENIFWNNVVNKIPPQFDGSDASTELLNRIYSKADKGSKINLPKDTFQLIKQYEKSSLAEKEASSLKDEAANKLKALLGDKEIGIIGDKIVSWKLIESERLDLKLLKTEQPEIYSKYNKISTYRRFSVKA